MTQYLLSVVTPAEGAEPPTPDELTAIMTRVESVQTRVRATSTWRTPSGPTCCAGSGAARKPRRPTGRR
jgi:hypothetical protein